MSNTLVDPADLGEFSGSLSEIFIDSAVARIRNLAGWHIAPVLEETVRARFVDGCTLVLPTMKLVDVTEIRAFGRTYSPTDFDFEDNGVITLIGGYISPWYRRTAEVDIVHGYESCPPELKPLITVLASSSTSMRDPSITRIQVGQVSTSYGSSSGSGSGSSGADDVLARYRIPEGVA